jgi:hypothetical protein
VRARSDHKAGAVRCTSEVFAVWFALRLNLYGCLSVCARQLVYHANINATVDRIKSRRRWNLLVVARETCSWWCGRYRYRRKAEPVFDLVGFSTPLAACQDCVSGWRAEPGRAIPEPWNWNHVLCFVVCCFVICFVICFVQQKCRVCSQELKSSQYLFCAGAGAGECTAVGAAVRGNEGSWGGRKTVCCSGKLQHGKTKGVLECVPTLSTLLKLASSQVGLCGLRKTKTCVVASGSQQELGRRVLEEERTKLQIRAADESCGRKLCGELASTTGESERESKAGDHLGDRQHIHALITR